MAKDVSLFDVALADVPDVHLVPPGEYKVRISKAESKNSKSNKPGRLLSLIIPDDPASQSMVMWVSDPNPEDPERTQQASLRRIKEVVQAFKLRIKTASQFLAIPDNELVGLEAFAMIDVRPETTDAESGRVYPKSNNITRFVIPA
jgi:hypothetical protein